MPRALPAPPQAGRLILVGGVYDLDTGLVSVCVVKRNLTDQ